MGSSPNGLRSVGKGRELSIFDKDCQLCYLWDGTLSEACHDHEHQSHATA